MTWHVSVGDNVVVDQPLASVETDKAVVEIPVPLSGRVVTLLAKPGDVIEVRAPLWPRFRSPLAERPAPSSAACLRMGRQGNQAPVGTGLFGQALRSVASPNAWESTWHRLRAAALKGP